jgi:hypothetical protein
VECKIGYQVERLTETKSACRVDFWWRCARGILDNGKRVKNLASNEKMTSEGVLSATFVYSEPG